MTPYYEQDGMTIYHGDCREVLLSMTADVVLTDPPYGISDSPITFTNTADGKRSGGGKRAGEVNTWHPTTDWDESIDPAWCRLVCIAAPVVGWFGHWRMRSVVEKAMLHPLRAEVVWAKDMHVGPPCPLAMRDERLWLFSVRGIKGRTFETSVWDMPIIPTWAYRHHKNEKPEGLMARAVTFLSDSGQTILDPFMGSGTTLVAAKRLRRTAIGIELDEKYCEVAAKRLSQGALPIEMEQRRCGDCGCVVIVNDVCSGCGERVSA